ncbi:MAG TPA: CPBP family intramembrane metalloprotease [Exilispira sp.]|nr:CPBP family intramembrane metalloprotease [Exilispira sp.]
MNKSKIKKNLGLKKSILFLSILPLKYQKKVLSHLSISEQNKIVKLVEKFGGFSHIKNMIDINKYKFFNKELKRLSNKKEDKNSFDLFLAIVLFIIGFLILVISIFKSSFENFIINFITTGYSNIFGPLLLLILVLNKKFDWDTNFTNLKSILRHLAEGLGCSILLIILLLQINAFYPQIGEKETDFLFLINTSFFIPFFEELLYRYILMTLLLRKSNRIIRILFSSIIFSLMHFPFVSIYLFFLYLLAAIILSAIYSFENYLLPSFLAHSIANLITFIL